MKKRLIVISCLLVLVMSLSAFAACANTKMDNDTLDQLLTGLKALDNQAISNTLPGQLQTTDAKGNDATVYVKWQVTDVSMVTIKNRDENGLCAVTTPTTAETTFKAKATLTNEKGKVYTNSNKEAYSVDLTLIANKAGTTPGGTTPGGTTPSGGTEATTTFVMQDQGFTDKAAIDKTISKDGITIEFSVGTGKTKPSYYTNNGGNAVRLYGGNTMTISGKTIVKVELTFATEYDSNEITVNDGTLTLPTWTGSTNSLVFTIGGTSGNRRITQIAVTYSA